MINFEETTRDPHELLSVRLISGQRIDIKRKNVVGYCTCALHPGAISKDIFLGHRCLEKNCFYFQRNPVGSYLKDLEDKQRRKALEKELRREKKERERAEESELNALKESWQVFLDNYGYDMEIIRVERDREKKNHFRIFYVSDRKYADGNMYYYFICELKFRHPHWKFQLRHIKDVNGRFLSSGEFHSLKIA